MQPTSRRLHSMPSPFRLAFAILALVLGLPACKENAANSTAAPSPPVHVESVVVSEQPMPRVLLLTGNLRGQHETDLAIGRASCRERVFRVV